MPNRVYKRTLKHRKAISDALKGRSPSNKTRRRMSISHTGVPLSPEHCAAISASLKGILRTPEHCAALSRSKKNSEAAKAAAEAQKGIPLSPEHIAAISAATKGVPKPPRTPEHCAALSKAHKDVSLSIEHRAAISEALKNSEAAKIAVNKTRGGHDIVEHHYIYDHNDLSKNTVGITRSDHAKLHNVLQKLGYIVPHINMKEQLDEDRNE